MKAFIIRWLAGGLIRDIAEGRRGAKLQAAYVWLQGKKTVTGFALGLALAALQVFQPDAAKTIGDPALMVAGLFVGWGLLDKTWRSTTPPEWVGEGLRFLVSLGPAASALVALIAQLRPDLAPTVDQWAAAVGGATAWLSAYLSHPPIILEKG